MLACLFCCSEGGQAKGAIATWGSRVRGRRAQEALPVGALSATHCPKKERKVARLWDEPGHSKTE